MKTQLLSQLKLPGGDEIGAPVGVPTASGGQTFVNIISWSLNILLILGILATLTFLIWGGISWITSGGDRDKLEKARKTIVYAVIGLVIILLSFVILQTVGTLVGLDLRSLIVKDN